VRDKYATHIDFTQFTSLGNRLPSNLDMVLERKGYFLVGEWKRENEKLSEGQKILLRNLARMKNFTVLIINGHSDQDLMVVNYFVVLDKNGNPKKQQPSSKEHLENLILKWLQKHDNEGSYFDCTQ